MWAHVPEGFRPHKERGMTQTELKRLLDSTREPTVAQGPAQHAHNHAEARTASGHGPCKACMMRAEERALGATANPALRLKVTLGKEDSKLSHDRRLIGGAPQGGARSAFESKTERGDPLLRRVATESGPGVCGGTGPRAIEVRDPYKMSSSFRGGGASGSKVRETMLDSDAAGERGFSQTKLSLQHDIEHWQRGSGYISRVGRDAGAIGTKESGRRKHAIEPLSQVEAPLAPVPDLAQLVAQSPLCYSVFESQVPRMPHGRTQSTAAAELGPGTYRNVDAGLDLVTPSRKVTYKSVFGSTTPRATAVDAPKRAPTPGAYDPPEQVTGGYTPRRGAMDISTTPRSVRLFEPREGDPGFGSPVGGPRDDAFLGASMVNEVIRSGRRYAVMGQPSTGKGKGNGKGQGKERGKDRGNGTRAAEQGPGYITPPSDFDKAARPDVIRGKADNVRHSSVFQSRTSRFAPLPDRDFSVHARSPGGIGDGAGGGATTTTSSSTSAAMTATAPMRKPGTGWGNPSISQSTKPTLRSQRKRREAEAAAAASAAEMTGGGSPGGKGGGKRRGLTLDELLATRTDRRKMDTYAEFKLRELEKPGKEFEIDAAPPDFDDFTSTLLRVEDMKRKEERRKMRGGGRRVSLVERVDQGMLEDGRMSRREMQLRKQWGGAK